MELARDIPACFWCGHSGEEHDEGDLADDGHEVLNATRTHVVGICACYRYERPEDDDHPRSKTPEPYVSLLPCYTEAFEGMAAVGQRDRDHR